jgi:hypothetical protein
MVTFQRDRWNRTSKGTVTNAVFETRMENDKFEWTNAEFGTRKRLCRKGKVPFMDCHWMTKRNGWEA